jgi:ferrous iron transport protein B
MGAPLTAEAPAASPKTSPGLTAGRVALLGNPNTGKTTVFNRLCGVLAKTSNFPGTTTAARFGRCALGDSGGPVPRNLEVVDLPGLYRLDLEVPESRICRSVLKGETGSARPDLVLVVVDANNLVRNLGLVGELQAYGIPMVVALNMVDMAQRRGLSFDVQKLSALLGCPVIPLIARRGTGLPELRKALGDQLGQLGSLGLAAGTRPFQANPTDRLDPADFPTLEDWAEQVMEQSVGGQSALGSGLDTFTERLDQAFTHPVLGILVFAGVMAGLFWTLFILASVPMDLIEATFGHLGEWVQGAVPAGPIQDLLVGGILGGIAGSVVFLPQICLLFFFISLLEDTGYLARAAFVMDRILCRFGLPGHAFVPLLSSHACAIPGIMSTRLIPDRHDRLTTILVAPLMSCSARLPVYVFLTGLLFADRPLLAGLAFAGCYLLGGAMALLTAFVTRRSLLKGRSRPMVLELPSYKAPSLRNALVTAGQQGLEFLKTAGTVIMAVCIVMWWLSTYPKSEPPVQAEQLRQQAAAVAASGGGPEQAAALEHQADVLEARHAQARSFAGRIGQTVQPVFAPLGYDWQLTVGVLTSFVAREVFVSTMAVLLVGDGEADLASRGVLDEIRTSRRDDGRPVFTLATAASLLVFFILAMQCLSTLVVTRKETGSWKWAGLQLAYMSALAYTFAFLTYQGLRLLGVS